jgi:hypothetical protein
VWTRDRWYWRLEREFWFKGKRVEGDGAKDAPRSPAAKTAPAR